jgi:glycosyltransferase involved in cell wall biosynthesis
VLAGARPAQAVRRLAELPGVEVHGDVPELAPFLARASVAIAPMASGSGVPMKVLEAWAAGVPVVAHPWAAAGLASADEPAVEVAEDPAQWIEALMRLLGDEQAAAKLAARGRAEWLATYHPDCVAEAVREAVNLAAGQRD